MWEEVNRIPDVTQVHTPVNRGWPCYEGSLTGSQVQPGWDALDKPVCEDLYAEGTSAVVAPYFSYQTRGPLLTPNEDCQNDTSSVSGVAFGSGLSNYPDKYKGAMFFSDFARSCVWVLGKKPNGDPDPTDIHPFVQHAETPVELVNGPGHDLYYVDYGLNGDGVPTEDEAGLHRIIYTGANAAPTAQIVTDQASGDAPLTVHFDATTSTDPDGDALSYSWDLDGDGTFGDSTAATPSHTYAEAGTFTVGLHVDDGHGHLSSATAEIQAGNTAPVIDSATPDASLAWVVGQTISFAATAHDKQDGALPDSAYKWNVAIRHCPSNVCHTHSLNTFTGPTGSFPAPDHEYPSHLLLTLTVTDSDGLDTSRTIELDPRIVTLSFASAPTGAQVTVNGNNHVTPYDETFIQGSRVTIIAEPANHAGTFTSWSDGGVRSHELSAPTTPTTYTATYAKPTARITTTPSPVTGVAPLDVAFDGSSSTGANPGDALTYDWDLDGNGSFETTDDPAPSHTYGPGTTTVTLRVTDASGSSATTTAAVTASEPGAPVAVIASDPASASGPAPLTVDLDGSLSMGTGPLTYAWDLDSDGQYGDATGVSVVHTFGVGTVVVGLQVTDQRGKTSTTTKTVSATNLHPRCPG